MAKPSIALSELLENGSDTDLLREMIQHIVQRVMEMDVENICVASYGETQSRAPVAGQLPSVVAGAKSLTVMR